MTILFSLDNRRSMNGNIGNDYYSIAIMLLKKKKVNAPAEYRSKTLFIDFSSTDFPMQIKRLTKNIGIGNDRTNSVELFVSAFQCVFFSLCVPSTQYISIVKSVKCTFALGIDYIKVLLPIRFHIFCFSFYYSGEYFTLFIFSLTFIDVRVKCDYLTAFRFKKQKIHFYTVNIMYNTKQCSTKTMKKYYNTTTYRMIQYGR